MIIQIFSTWKFFGRHRRTAWNDQQFIIENAAVFADDKGKYGNIAQKTDLISWAERGGESGKM